MAASDNLNKILFPETYKQFNGLASTQYIYHGTGGEITGGIVKPGIRNTYGIGAYATRRKHTAEHFAKEKAQEQGRLFGTVYRVEPVSEDPEVVGMEGLGEKDLVKDKKGLKVLKPVSYPLNPDAQQS